MRIAWTALLCLLVGTALDARPYAVDDMLRLEDYGRAIFDPAERLVLVEKLRGHDTAAHYDFDYFTRWQRSRIMVAAVHGAGGLEPLFEQEADAGYWLANFSPSGARLAVYRLKSDRIDLGIVDMKSRHVTWTGNAPTMPMSAANPVWRSDDRLIFVAGEEGSLPLPLDFAGRAQKLLPKLWQRQAEGREDSAIVYESGMQPKVGTLSRQRLIELDIVTGAAHDLAQGNFVDLSLSPDGRAIAFVERGDDVPAPKDAFPLDFQSRRLRLSVLALADDRLRRICVDCDLAPDLLSWAPDGSRLLYLARHDGEPWSRAKMRLADTRDGDDRALDLGDILPVLESTTPGRLTGKATWQGADILFSGRKPGGEAGWYRLDPRWPHHLTRLSDSSAGPTITKGDKICMRDRTGYRRVRADGYQDHMVLPSDFQPLASGDPFAEGTRSALASFVTGRLGFTAAGLLGLFDCADGKTRAIADLPAGDHVLALGTRSHVAVVRQDFVDGHSELGLIAERRRSVDRINLHLVDVDKPRTIALHHERDGQKMTDWLLLPVSGRPPFPMVVLPYPGQIFADDIPPATAGVASFQPAASPSLLAAAGYAVLLPAMPAGAAEPGEDIVASLKPALDVALKTALIDPERVAVFGHSYGGYAALVLATRTDWFKAVIASSAAADLTLSYAAWDPRLKTDFPVGQSTLYEFAWAETGQGRMGAPPWQAGARYVRNSPFYSFDKLSAPMLLLHGDLDPVPVQQAERSLAALYRLGKPGRLIVFAGEGHVPASPANIRLRYQAIFGFLANQIPARLEHKK